MTTGPDGVVHIATMTGMASTSVDRVAKLLKRANPPMWARSPQGGGFKAEHLQSTHLTNIVLALAMADPSSRAVATTEAYRVLLPLRSEKAALGEADFLPPWGEDASLGAGLDRTMEVFRDPKMAFRRREWHDFGFYIVLEADPPRAWVRFRDAPHWDTEYRGEGHAVEPGQNPQAPKLPATFMQRPVILTCELFEALADLLEVSAEDTASTPSFQDIPGPGKENAGLPGPASLANDTSLPGPVPPFNNASLFDAPLRQHAHTSGVSTRKPSVRNPLPSRGAEDMAGQLQRMMQRDRTPNHHP